MKIKCAAIKYKGAIYEGESHSKIGIKMVADGVCEKYPGGEAQGFVTECGIFVCRAPAYIIAWRAGQIDINKTICKNELFSEDLNNKQVVTTATNIEINHANNP
jgi:hypothetical protein